MVQEYTKQSCVGCKQKQSTYWFIWESDYQQRRKLCSSQSKWEQHLVFKYIKNPKKFSCTALGLWKSCSKDNVSTSSGSYLWQSFDYPSDTLLPDMKISWNINTGSERYLTSWKSTDDPSTGNFSYKINMKGLPQLVVVMGSIIKFRTEPWNGVRFNGLPRPANSAFHQIIMGFKEDEWYYKFEPNKNVAAS
ncbi:PREDICTED: S-locus-specific glycoprotein S6-like [Prunus mume]|uniref:S-locus-specific glycoprotein S6-like n=1 Tax=Prunus mume TaxID=102107 RepID=A0ABM0NM04_PRUMU|nr:PREDICTED: S-locus-specific glycoprotein S6-like [Prunus mume]